MRPEDPVAAALFLRPVTMEEREQDPGLAHVGLRAQPAHGRPRDDAQGIGPYPRPLLTANFSLLEAKRLLNIMDYALLQGGANFIVVAKKGTDQHRASSPS
jgi:hypothetical protein